MNACVFFYYFLNEFDARFGFLVFFCLVLSLDFDEMQQPVWPPGGSISPHWGTQRDSCIREAEVLTSVRSDRGVGWGGAGLRGRGWGGGALRPPTVERTQKHSSCFPVRHTIERQVTPSGGLTEMNCGVVSSQDLGCHRHFP